MKTEVIVNLAVEGLHCWSNCNIESVMYLRDVHRHIFHIQCRKEVKHNDRDVEIISFKNLILRYLASKYGTPCFFGGLSCESIANELVDQFMLSSCSVLEDGENGAIVTV